MRKKRTKSAGGKRRWMQKARKRMEQKGTVGAFRRAARAAGMTTAAFARHVLSNRDRYSKKRVLQANFARNAMKARKK